MRGSLRRPRRSALEGIKELPYGRFGMLRGSNRNEETIWLLFDIENQKAAALRFPLDELVYLAFRRWAIAETKRKVAPFGLEERPASQVADLR
ncbi:MAG: hypothetical protein KGJ66_08230 [Alphaproteobacteria bacterium]|nr:hypothetical protein [Alphaproteobacteria bacterium]